ncbi:MAG: ferredoxin-type protein NapF [Epsilonproteobacteria bacterium]|nr:ferredoxin-type protein NapF [Campylobacterota bacterium]
MERRELFRSLARITQGKQEDVVIRPPYNADVSLFHKECVHCEGSCAAVCEEQIIKISADKTPCLDFSQSGCTFCDECVKACTFGVLDLQVQSHQIDAVISINQDKCVSWEGVMCFSCKDPCLDNAIDFQAMFMPKINTNCTNCGFCISRCPVDAIEVGAA